MEKKTIFMLVPRSENGRWKNFDDAFEYLHGKTFSPSEELPFKNAEDFLYKIEDKFDAVDEMGYYDDIMKLCNDYNELENTELKLYKLHQDFYKIAVVTLEFE